jgi:hypothetical protein
VRPPDAGMVDVAPPDVGGFAACREFVGPATSVPAHVMGSIFKPDVQSPACATVDAPYGIESSGADAVIAIDGLAPSKAYIVDLRSAADLSFYVATGCSTSTGPADNECALFVDARTMGNEVGRFVASGTSAFVVVDHYASATPANTGFTLDVYPEACGSDADCTSALPVCSSGKCVQCADSFDCKDMDVPICDTTALACVAGVDTCASEDSSEPEDDGPSGAYQFVTNGAGNASTTSEICSSPRGELDYYAFEVTTLGETWDITLDWSGGSNLDFDLYDAQANQVGMSHWEHPEVARLRYLALGWYYIAVRKSGTDPTPTPYSIAVKRTAGTACTSRSDCADDYRNQLFRGECQAGACVAIAGDGGVSQGGACDSMSDCAPGLACPSFYFVADADTRNVCAPTCTATTDCAALGPDYVCTGYLIQNICVQQCTSDDQCPVDIDSLPMSGPWYRLRCHQGSGRCVL